MARPDPDAAVPGAPVVATVKRMSLSEAEFRSGVAALLPGSLPGSGATWSGDLPARVPFSGGSVTLSYTPLPPVRLGGLLQLPQAEVTLAFEGIGPAERIEFERRFWIVFQRGGG